MLIVRYVHIIYANDAAAKKLPKLTPRPPSSSRTPDTGRRPASSTLHPDGTVAARPASGARPGSGRFSRADSGFINVPKVIDVQIVDLGRTANVKCPIICVLGSLSLS